MFTTYVAKIMAKIRTSKNKNERAKDYKENQFLAMCSTLGNMTISLPRGHILFPLQCGVYSQK
mgnify:CR=1 FL=1|jgi:hypothetical protein